MVLLGKNDSLPYLIYQTTSGTWYSRGKLPNPAGVKFRAIATGPGNGGSLQVLLLGATDSLPYLIYQTTSGNWIWAGHLPAFGSTKFTAIAAGRGNSHQLQVIGLGTTDSLAYLIWQDEGGAWHSGGHLSAFRTTKFRTVTSAGDACCDSDNLLQFILLGANDSLAYQIYQESSGFWGSAAGPITAGWQLIKFSAVAALANGPFPSTADVIGLHIGDGAPYVFATEENTVVCWCGPLGGGAHFSAVAAGIGNSEHTQVIGLGATDGLPYLNWSDGFWYPTTPLPTPNSLPFKTLATGNGNGGSLQVILLGRDNGLPYVLYQTTSGNWIWGDLLPDP